MLAAVPGVWHIGSRFLAGGAPGYGEAAPGDHLQTSYHLWLFGDQIENGRYPWRDNYSFRPESQPTVNAAAWPFGLVYWPLSHVFGSRVLTWNLFLLATFVAAGLLAFAWLRELGLPRGPALVGGLVYEIAPYRAVQSAGHLLGSIAILLPLSLWALERGRRGNPLWLLLSAASIASIPLSGQVHLAIGAIPFYAAYALARIPAVTRRLSFYLGGAALGVALAVGAGILIQRAVIEGSINSRGRSLREVSAYSAQWLDFFSRDQRHGSESFVFLGWVTPWVALAGLVALVLTRRYLLALVLGLGAIVPMVLALGTNTFLYRPIRDLVPGLEYPRVPERLMPVACLAVAALVAYALDAVRELDLRAYARRTWTATRSALPSAGVMTAVAAAAVVAVLADLHVEAMKATAADSGNRAYELLRGGAPDARLLEVPVFEPDVHYGSVYEYYDMTAKRQRPGGYSTTAPVVTQVIARKLSPLNCGDWTSHPGALLKELGVRQIAFHTGLFVLNPKVPRRAWFAWRALQQHGYRAWARDGVVWALDRKHRRGLQKPPVPEPSRKNAQLCQGWHPNYGAGRAMSSSHAALWAYGDTVRLFMRSDSPVTVHFGVDGAGKLTRRVRNRLEEVRVPLGEPGWHLVTLDSPVLPVRRGVRVGARLVAYQLG